MSNIWYPGRIFAKSSWCPPVIVLTRCCRSCCCFHCDQKNKMKEAKSCFVSLFFQHFCWSWKWTDYQIFFSTRTLSKADFWMSPNLTQMLLQMLFPVNNDVNFLVLFLCWNLKSPHMFLGSECKQNMKLIKYRPVWETEAFCAWEPKRVVPNGSWLCFKFARYPNTIVSITSFMHYISKTKCFQHLAHSQVRQYYAVELAN